MFVAVNTALPTPMLVVTETPAFGVTIGRCDGVTIGRVPVSAIVPCAPAYVANSATTLLCATVFGETKLTETLSDAPGANVVLVFVGVQPLIAPHVAAIAYVADRMPVF